MIRDQSLLTRARSEVNASYTTTNTNISPCFDIAKLCNQPLLQSSYAETLRMYIAVYIIRKPEYEDAQVLDYKIPKDKMIVVSSAMAHMDKRNWNLGVTDEHPVESFWAERFLSHDGNTHRPPSASSIDNIRPTFSSVASTNSVSAVSSSSLPERNESKELKESKEPKEPKENKEPKFSLNGYSGAWIPFGGGIHQCPGRHWVKLQMLLSFAIISAAFDIELLAGEAKLGVDMAKYGLGALQPAEKAGFRIRRRKTAV